jgi:hypothetical protein
VFVPEAGGRWGAPARLQVTFDPDIPIEEEDPQLNVIVEENDEKITRIGTEVDIGDEPKDPKTGENAVEGREFVCYCGSFVTKEIESKKNGTANEKRNVYTTHEVYVDVKPWIKFLSNYENWETTNIYLRCDSCPPPPDCPQG